MIAVLADDLSGAAELANAALRHGLSAEVQTVFDPEAETDVICVDTDSRSLAPAGAAVAVEAVARRIAGAAPDWIYKKCDSVVRGHVRTEIRAILAATGQARAVLIPANPSRGRVIRGGHLFVDGLPLHRTAFAHDPEHPRTTSQVAELLGGDLGGILVPDLESAQDLARQAAALDAATLPCGGVDFFEALLARRGFALTSASSAPAHRPIDPASAAQAATLLICGSATAWPHRRHEAEAHRIPVFSQPLPASEIVAALRLHRKVLVGIGTGPVAIGAKPAELTLGLALSAAAIMGRVAVGRVLVEGGATAAAILRTRGWTRLVACAASAPGVGTLRPFGPSAPVLSIKPGSYRWPAELWP
jgi:uncharacterized protein YgbK (DUF1537 family)